MLANSEIWALEDISDEYANIKLKPRFGISIGPIFDSHVGVWGFRMENITFGPTYREAWEMLKSSPSVGSIVYSKTFKDRLGDLLSNTGAADEELNPNSFLLTGTYSSETSKLEANAGSAMKNLLFGKGQGEEFSNAIVETYLSDGAPILLRSISRKDKRRGDLLSVCSWNPLIVLTLYIQRNAEAETWKEDFGILEFCRDYQHIIETTLLACKRYDKMLHKIHVSCSGGILLTCIATESTLVNQKADK